MSSIAQNQPAIHYTAEIVRLSALPSSQLAQRHPKAMAIAVPLEPELVIAAGRSPQYGVGTGSIATTSLRGQSVPVVTIRLQIAGTQVFFLLNGSDRSTWNLLKSWREARRAVFALTGLSQVALCSIDCSSSIGTVLESRVRALGCNATWEDFNVSAAKIATSANVIATSDLPQYPKLDAVVPRIVYPTERMDFIRRHSPDNLLIR